MTKDEALDLALEIMRNQGDVGVDEWMAAEAAIKQARSEQQEPIGGATVYVHQSDDKGDVLGERWKAAHVKFKDGFLDQFAQGAKFDLYITPPSAQPAPVQEPFGYVSQHTTPGPFEWQFSKTFAGVYRDTAKSITPVYTTPPAAQRQWVGLTDKEIRNWWSSENGLEDCDICKIDDFVMVVKAIEAKLKEKNT